MTKDEAAAEVGGSYVTESSKLKGIKMRRINVGK